MAEPSLEAVEAANEFLLDEIFYDLSLIGSYTTSALEACRRNDLVELRLRLRSQLRDLFKHVLELHALLSPERTKEGGGS
jgi:hypothetical protein